MKKLNAHAKIEIAILTLLALGSCGGGSDFQFNDSERDEIASVASGVAYDVVSEHEKIGDLEDRISDLEEQTSELERRVGY